MLSICSGQYIINLLYISWNSVFVSITVSSLLLTGVQNLILNRLCCWLVILTSMGKTLHPHYLMMVAKGPGACAQQPRFCRWVLEQLWVQCSLPPSLCEFLNEGMCFGQESWFEKVLQAIYLLNADTNLPLRNCPHSVVVTHGCLSHSGEFLNLQSQWFKLIQARAPRILLFPDFLCLW